MPHAAPHEPRGSGSAPLNLAPGTSTILLSILPNPCYDTSFDQKTSPIAAGFNEVGMVDLTAAGRRTAEPEWENRGGSFPTGVWDNSLISQDFREENGFGFRSVQLGFPSAWAWNSFSPAWNSFSPAWNSFRARCGLGGPPRPPSVLTRARRRTHNPKR